MTRTALALALALAFVLSACERAGPERAGPARAVEARLERGVQVARITVGPDGYVPAAVALRAGVPARLVFTRTTDGTCGTEVHAPSLGVRETALPLGRPVAVEFTPEAAGRFAFACGMDMMEGAIVVRS